MRLTSEHRKLYSKSLETKLSVDEQDHLLHLATTPLIKKIIPSEHLKTLSEQGFVKQTLGGHVITHLGDVKLMYEGE